MTTRPATTEQCYRYEARFEILDDQRRVSELAGEALPRYRAMAKVHGVLLVDQPVCSVDGPWLVVTRGRPGDEGLHGEGAAALRHPYRG